MGQKFNQWLNNLPTLIKSFDGFNSLISANPNPPQNLIDQWQSLVGQRDEALKELSLEHQAISENYGPSSYPWLGQFKSSASRYGTNANAKAYLRPVAESFYTLVRFKCLNTGKSLQASWRLELSEFENLLEHL